VKFLWWVIDGQPARLTVSHPLYGTEIRPAEREPEPQARRLARRLLEEAAGVKAAARTASGSAED
jgi:hypothetical protein